MFQLASQGEGPADYPTLLAQAESLMRGEHDLIANAANLASLVYHQVPDLNWVGFYLVRDQELVVGPFQGLPACVRIAHGRGVCGTAWATAQRQVVDDVEAFPGHIPCDAASRSEVVIPLLKDGRVFAVLDVDSPTPARFAQADVEGLQAIADLFVRCCQNTSI